ncbi:universal stress protein PHOS32 isoform X2 [Aegilops tauschii subsp. strangulata]|uniref:universal stress protein PHOS32 isoform X2 n=1 Tax=Aegilops tauschii subsp. strangulata TaxID=200361 RepID=UPI003CC8CC94
MAEAKAAPAMVKEAEGSGRRKTVVLVAVDDSDHSYRALEWAVRHVATAGVAAELVVVHAKPPASSVVTFGSPAAAGDVVRVVDVDLRKRAEDVVDRARRLCVANSVTATTPARRIARSQRHFCNMPNKSQVHGLIEVMEGEARYVLCDAVDKHHADLLVVGSHGYGAIKRAFLGSVSDYCAHHAHCSVMIVKQPKSKK